MSNDWLLVILAVPLGFYLLSRLVDLVGGVKSDTEMPPWYSAFQGPFLDFWGSRWPTSLKRWDRD
ncbi:MAG: hypothetical protein HY319_07320 [Armatimonadetes bacterium]|nr:hypothetical protein [Armatimonadota bacterium]